MIFDSSFQPISPLRARMIEDMSVRAFKEDTRRDYVRHARAFAAFIGRSPDTATAEELRLLLAQRAHPKGHGNLPSPDQRPMNAPASEESHPICRMHH